MDKKIDKKNNREEFFSTNKPYDIVSYIYKLPKNLILSEDFKDKIDFYNFFYFFRNNNFDNISLLDLKIKQLNNKTFLTSKEGILILGFRKNKELYIRKIKNKKRLLIKETVFSIFI